MIIRIYINISQSLLYHKPICAQKQWKYAMRFIAVNEYPKSNWKSTIEAWLVLCVFSLIFRLNQWGSICFQPFFTIPMAHRFISVFLHLFTYWYKLFRRVMKITPYNNATYIYIHKKCAVFYCFLHYPNSKLDKFHVPMNKLLFCNILGIYHDRIKDNLSIPLQKKTEKNLN